MIFLLDTHLLIWSLIAPGKLSRGALAIMNDTSHDFLFSAISIWKIGVKFALGRPDFGIDPKVARQTLLSHGLKELSFIGFMQRSPHPFRSFIGTRLTVS